MQIKLPWAYWLTHSPLALSGRSESNSIALGLGLMTDQLLKACDHLSMSHRDASKEKASRARTPPLLLLLKIPPLFFSQMHPASSPR